MSNVNKAITELNKTWRSVLSKEIEADYFKKIILKLNREYDSFSDFPEMSKQFLKIVQKTMTSGKYLGSSGILTIIVSIIDEK